MSAVIEGKSLGAYAVAEDGSSVRFELRDRSGRTTAIELPAECVSALIMTLPGIMEQAIRRRYRDISRRLVFPANEWTLELAADNRTLIMWLATPDGFKVAFALSEATCQELGEALSDGAEQRPARSLQ